MSEEELFWKSVLAELELRVPPTPIDNWVRGMQLLASRGRRVRHRPAGCAVQGLGGESLCQHAAPDAVEPAGAGGGGAF